MPYNLIVTRADGVTFTTLRSPYDTRADTVRTVWTIIATPPTPVAPDEGMTFANRVATAPLGETVTHPGLKIGFRTEEASPTT